MRTTPFDHNYFIGYVSQVNPQFIKIHFPSSVLLNKFIFSGEEFNGGLVGNFIVIEGDSFGFIGKLLELSLPEKERLDLTEKAFQLADFHPTAKAEVLLSFNYFEPLSVSKGLDCYPNIGAKVFVCSSSFIQDYFKRFGLREDDDSSPYINLATLTSNMNTEVTVSQQAIFSRHCAVVGTTGGGKSWTVAKLIEGIKLNKSKAILLDPTGEYENIVDGSVVSVALARDVYFHYSKLKNEDLFYLLQPAGRVQFPKLMDAVRSLKMVSLDHNGELSDYIDNGLLIKQGKTKRPLEVFYYNNIGHIENGLLNFDIKKLPSQITCECVFDTDRGDMSKFGGRNDADVSNCVSLISRANNLLNNGIYKSVFGFDKEADQDNDLTKIMEAFLSDESHAVLRIGFEEVGFEYQSREIMANSIANYLLDKARRGVFKTNPVVLFVDEAHQFLNKKVQDENFQFNHLNAFDQIAKECRKYGLFLCIATQMPRDIPVGTLSQMGTFIVHRLINQYDKEAIVNACSAANHSILSFLPVLGEGEAILAGVDFPMPISVKITEPAKKPDSKTPRFKTH